jgi:SNF2 family DNA or RNA helicase
MRWFVNNDIISLELQNGNAFVPSAKQIYLAEFKGNCSINGITVTKRPSQDLPHIIFSKYPLDVFLVITPPKAELSRSARCNIAGIREKTRINIAYISEEMPDHILAGNNWYPLVKEVIGEIRKLLVNNGVSDLGDLSLKQYLELRRISFDWLIVEEREEESKDGIGPVVTIPPQQFAGKLYPYQEDGYRWLKMIAKEDLGCILADEMGLGKTVQIIALLCDEKALGRSPSLIIAPTTILENWKREITKFAPKVIPKIHRGSERTGFPSDLKAFDLIITSYETAVRDLSLLEMIKWNIVVVDEAQAIKNPSARRTEVLKQIPRRAAIAVTGTPLENHLTDLWSVTDFVLPGLLGDLFAFQDTYSDDIAGAIALEPLISPILLRRRVAEVARDLPPRIDIPQSLELGEEAAMQYDLLRRDILSKYGHGASLAALTELRMFCTHPLLLEERDDDPVASSTKYARLIEILEEILLNNEKVLVFTSYRKMIQILVNDIPRRFGTYTDYIDGTVEVEERQGKVDRFGKQLGAALLVLNPKAAGIGLNIAHANHVIHYNLEWNPAVEDQASARAYRRGQTRPVTVHRLFYSNTIEEIIDQRIQKKRDMSGHAVIGHDGKLDDLADIVRALEISPIFGGHDDG